MFNALRRHRRIVPIVLGATVAVVALVGVRAALLSSVRFQYWWRMRHAKDFKPIDREWIARITSLGPEVTPFLVETLREEGGEDGEWNKAAIALYALRDMKDPGAVPLLTALATDTHATWRARYNAMGVLQELSEAAKGANIVGSIARVAVSDANPRKVRESAVWLLEELLGRQFSADRTPEALIESALQWWREEGARVYGGRS